MRSERGKGHLDRVVKNERYDTSLSGKLIMRSTTSFDDRHAPFQTTRYAVDSTTGIIGNALIENTWRDAARHVVKSLPAGSQIAKKVAFDSLGRQTAIFTGYNYNDTNYATAISVTGDTILEQAEASFDAAGNVVEVLLRQRNHDASGTGLLGTPSSAQPRARVKYVAVYPDSFGRTAATADYGTNGGAALNRSSAIPARSDTCLVTSATFNARGEAYLSTDPAGTVTNMTFDDRGRRTSLVENYVPTGSSSSSTSANTCGPGDDKNRMTSFTYAPDGLPATITVVNTTMGNQTTTYTYGSTLNDSAIASSLLKRYETCPDSVSGSDQIAFTYNRQLQVTTKTDQNGTVHSYDFDRLGRPTADRIMTLGSGVDNAVLRISMTYEVRGLIQNITSYDNATVGQGNVVNDVQKTYNSFQQLTTEYQSHSGAVNVSTTPNVQYAYANGSANTVRPTSLTYPNGRVVNYNYGAANGTNDAASRIASLIDNDGVTHLADYSYLGAGAIIQVNEPQPAIQYTLIGIQGGNDPATGDIYRGLDLFSRVKDLIWVPSGSSSSSSSSSSAAAGTNLVRIQHGYDRAGNRLWRKDLVAESYNAGLDELYAYDGLYRLKSVSRGTLNSSQTAIQLGSGTFNQCWTLDATGNWKGFREDDAGGGTWNLVQSRSANSVNEITGISNSVGSAWANPAYDKNGNMTTIPQPATPASSYSGTYDAWNRLVKLVDNSSAQTVQTNAYDGRKYRTIRSSFTAGALSETRHYFCTSRWQVLEERVASSTAPDRQYVWGPRFTDDLVLRDRDAANTGVLTERLWAIQDANWNVTSAVSAPATVEERYTYTPYGVQSVLVPSFAARPSSLFGWELGLAGYRADLLSGFYAVRQRFLHTAGTWLSRDPQDTGRGESLYMYARSNPITNLDPTGGPSTGSLHGMPVVIEMQCAEMGTAATGAGATGGSGINIGVAVTDTGLAGAGESCGVGSGLANLAGAIGDLLGQWAVPGFMGILGVGAIVQKAGGPASTGGGAPPGGPGGPDRPKTCQKPCTVIRTPPLGGSSAHDALVASLQGGDPDGYLVTTPEGLSCNFDGGPPPNLWEVKTGHTWLGKPASLLEGISYFVQRAEALLEQCSRCSAVAARCGFTYSLYVETPVAQGGFQTYFGGCYMGIFVAAMLDDE